MLCLKAKNGKVLWSKHLVDDFDAREPQYGFTASPILEGNLLLLNANSRMLALDRNAGTLTWSVEDEAPGESMGTYSTGVVAEIDGKRCALLLGTTALHVVEVETGDELWTFEHGDGKHPVADPMVKGNRVLLSLAHSCLMLELSESGVRDLWRSSDLNTMLAPPLCLDAHLYGTHWPADVFVSSWSWDWMLRLDWPFRCVNWETGDVMWEKTMESTAVTAAGEMLMILELGGTLHIVEASPDSFRERSSTDVLSGRKAKRLFATPPVLLEGKIYCRNYNGELVCIDVSE